MHDGLVGAISRWIVGLGRIACYIYNDAFIVFGGYWLSPAWAWLCSFNN